MLWKYTLTRWNVQILFCPILVAVLLQCYYDYFSTAPLIHRPWCQWNLHVWCCWPMWRVHCCFQNSGRLWAHDPASRAAAPSLHWSVVSPPDSGHGYLYWGLGILLPCRWEMLGVCHILQRRHKHINWIYHNYRTFNIKTRFAHGTDEYWWISNTAVIHCATPKAV